MALSDGKDVANDISRNNGLIHIIKIEDVIEDNNCTKKISHPILNLDIKTCDDSVPVSQTILPITESIDISSCDRLLQNADFKNNDNKRSTKNISNTSFISREQNIAVSVKNGLLQLKKKKSSRQQECK